MKLNRTTLFIANSSIALLIVLVIQVNWILQTAKSKEDFFNEKANIVLARTTEAISTDKELCNKLGSGIGIREKRKIDSLFRHYMDYYNFHLNYSFEVVKSITPFTFSQTKITSSSDSTSVRQACYSKSLDQLANENGWVLKLNLPERKNFILAEMGMPFIASVVLIVVVLVLFWKTVSSLMAEKRISEHTADFLNNMTHEFKTPLTNIALAGRMIVKDSTVKHEEKIKHYSGIILEENEKLRLQVEQVLSMTALERGEIPIHKTELDFHQLINDALKSISIQIENKQGHLELHLDAERFVIMGDKTQLTNAMCNLIDNAIKYSGEKPELSIRTFNRDQQFVVEVSDKGIGIEKQYHKKVFDKFFRVPTGDRHDVKGFGLGLAYIKKMVELHEGTIELQSEKGKGTTFTITLPNA